jgi:LuxR family transcriptional regulator, maltose regulon positive regulatory protein
VQTGKHLAAMHYFYAAGDFESLLSVVELDRGNSFGNDQKELIIKYFEECPEEYKRRHMAALFIYAIALITFNEMGLFKKICQEVTMLIHSSSSLDPDSAKSLMGELRIIGMLHPL